MDNNNNNNNNNNTIELETSTNNSKPIQIIDNDKKDLESNDNKEIESKKSTSKYSRYHPKYYLSEHLDECKILGGSMFYKFAFETYSGALGLVVLTRFENDNGVTFLAIMNIIYFLSQSIGSMLVSPFVKKYRASRVTASVMFSMALLISIFIIIGATTGTKLDVDHLGSWNRYLVIPLYLLMGIFVGMIEVSRKLIPRQILGNDNKRLSKLNGLIHLFYECAGTAGAFLSTPLIEKLGPVFALVHLPVCFIVASCIFFFVSQPFPPTIVKLEKGTSVGSDDGKFISVCKSAVYGVYEYFNSLAIGARHVLSIKYWWFITTYVLPQVLHRLLENLLFPTFAKKVLHQGSLSGILTGSSNFGEAIGALLVVKFGNRLKNPLNWVRLDGLVLPLCWILVYPPKLANPTHVAASMIPIFAVVSCFWAAGDISLLSFIQSKFPLNSNSEDNTAKEINDDKISDTDSEKSDISEINTSRSNFAKTDPSIDQSSDDLSKELADANQQSTVVEEVVENDISDEDDAPSGTPLASVLGFLFATYAIIISLLSYGLGNVMDTALANGDISKGFLYVAGIGFSVCGGLIIISTFFARNQELRKN